MFQSLSEPNLHRLHLPEPRISEMAPHLQTRLEALHASPLWNESKQRWNLKMSEQQVLLFYDGGVGAALLDIAIESFVGCGDARQRLVEHPPLSQLFYNDPLLAHVSCLNFRGFLDRDEQYALITDYLVRPAEAREKIQALLQSEGWAEFRAPWDAFDKTGDPGAETTCCCSDRLFQIFVKGILNPDAAYSEYCTFKTSPLWDRTGQMWIREVGDGSLSTVRDTHTHLIDVLALTVIDPAQAGAALIRLQQSPLWDAARQQWNFDMHSTTEHAMNTNRYSVIQLLGLVAEALIVRQCEPETAPQRLPLILF